MSISKTPEFSTADFEAMSRALQLAREGLYTTSPNPRVGAVIVNNGKIIGEGLHRHCGDEHAEVMALKQAGDAAKGGSCYITLEPCAHHGQTPPCTEALITAGISRVFAAIEDPNPKVAGRGFEKLQAAGIEVCCGLMATEATELNPGFISRMLRQRPWVVSKLAMSADGRTALASGESQWISSEQSRVDVHQLRARVCAVITGSGTVMSDNPRMTVRLDYKNIRNNGEQIDPRQPLKVVIDGQQRLNPGYDIFQKPSMIVLPKGSESVDIFSHAGVEVMQVAEVDGKLDLSEVVTKLATDYQVNELMLEAGAGLNGAFLNAGLIDEMRIYMAPKLMGDGGKGLFHLPQINTMKDNINLQFTDIRRVGADVRITCKPISCCSEANL